MGKTIFVDCPFCEGLLEVNPSSGKVIQEWKSSDRKKSSSEKLNEAFAKMKEDKEKRKDLFSAKKEEIEESKRKAQSAFEEEIRKAKKNPPEKPFRPFDLD